VRAEYITRARKSPRTAGTLCETVGY